MARRAEDHKPVFPVGTFADSGLGRMGGKNNQQSPRPLCRPRAAGWVLEMLRRTPGHSGGQQWRPTVETAQIPMLPGVRVESPEKSCCSQEAQARPTEGDLPAPSGRLKVVCLLGVPGRSRGLRKPVGRLWMPTVRN